MKRTQYATDELVGKLPKGVKASSWLVVELKATCSACGHTETLKEESSGQYNAPFAIRERLKYTLVSTNRDRRSSFNMEFLLCPDCNRAVQGFMAGLNELPEPVEQLALEAAK